VVIMDENQKQIDDLKTKIANLEGELEAAKRALFELTNDEGSTFVPDTSATQGKIIEGVFNGENMVAGEGKTFPVPANYASKSKLVEGDRLKLTISSDGSFIFKQIGPIERRKAIGNLKFENNAYIVEAEEKNYHLLYASVTYHKAKPGDKVAIVIPAGKDSSWCALESVIHDVEANEANFTNDSDLNNETEPEISVAQTEVDNPTIPSDARIAPNYVDTLGDNLPQTDISLPESTEITETVADITEDPEIEKVRDSLGINDIEISGPKGSPAPEAVNPQSESPQASSGTATQASPNSTTVDARAEAIEELEI